MSGALRTIDVQFQTGMQIINQYFDRVLNPTKRKNLQYVKERLLYFSSPKIFKTNKNGRKVHTSAGSVTIAPIPAGVVQPGIIAGRCSPLLFLLISGSVFFHLSFIIKY